MFRLLFLLLLFSCHSPKNSEPVVVSPYTTTNDPASILKQQRRFLQVIYPLLSEAAVFTEDLKESFGFTLHDLSSYQKSGNVELVNYVKTQYKMGRSILVSYVHPGLAADLAGVQEGDRLLAINGHPIDSLNAGSAMEIMQDVAGKGEELAVALERKGKVFITRLASRSIADIEILLVSDPEVNAYVEGSSITLTSGMMDFFPSDAELASVIAHELSHSLLHHINKRAASVAEKRLVDLGLPINLTYDKEPFLDKDKLVLYPPSYEIAADRLAFYLLARAGFALPPAKNAWLRLRNESKGPFNKKHQLEEKRTLAMDTLLREIDYKTAQQSALVAPAELLRP